MHACVFEVMCTFASICVSKFVPPGSIRIGVVSSNEDLEATGFVTPDNTTAVVVMNSHDDPITYKLLDEISTLAVNVTIPAHAIQTVLYSV